MVRIGRAVVAGGALALLCVAHPGRAQTLDGSFPATDGPVTCIVRAGETVYICGGFSSVGDQARYGIAAIDAATGRVTPWNPTANGFGGYSVDAIAVSGSTVYVGGSFTFIGGAWRSNIAALDTTLGTALPWNPGANGQIFALAVSGTTLYAGGRFSIVGGKPRGRIAALDAYGGVIDTWNPGAGGSQVNALVADGHTVYAGGPISSLGGAPCGLIGAVDAASGAVIPWNGAAGAATLPSVNAIAVSGSTVYVGGVFGVIGGQLRSNLAALDAANGNATPWNPGADAAVGALAVSDGTVYAGGVFTTIGGQPRGSLAALDAAGAATAWNPGLNEGGLVRALAAAAGTVYVGGNFTSIGGRSHPYLAAFLPDTLEMAFSLTPSVLGPSSRGGVVTGILEPASPYTPSQIEVGSIRVNDVVTLDPRGPIEIGDHDGNGVRDLAVKFDRAALEQSLAAGEGVPVTVTGRIAVHPFVGVTHVRMRGTAAAPHPRGRAGAASMAAGYPPSDGATALPDPTAPSLTMRAAVRSGGLEVDFTLADGSPARLEMVDVSGRILASLDVGGLGAGAHTVGLGGSALRSGIYFLRLVQANRQVRARAAFAK